jgi:hypothetical protein
MPSGYIELGFHPETALKEPCKKRLKSKAVSGNSKDGFCMWFVQLIG